MAERQSPAGWEGRRKLDRGAPTDLGMRARGAVIGPPTGRHSFCLGQRGEQRLIEQLVAKAAVEALGEAVLHRLAWRNVVPLNPALLGPGENDIAGEVGAVVGDDHLWFSALGDQPIELASHMDTRQ